MAQIETWFNQDIDKPVNVRYLGGNVFNNDNKGNKIGVRLFQNGQAVNITGGVVGYCILATGISIPVAGTASGNAAWIELPDTAYAVPGNINIIIKNTNGDTVSTIAAVVSSVVGFGDVVEDPSQQTIDAWTAQINSTITALQTGVVRYDATQSLSSSQKLRARNNIGANTSQVSVSDEDYRIIVP